MFAGHVLLSIVESVLKFRTEFSNVLIVWLFNGEEDANGEGKPQEVAVYQKGLWKTSVMFGKLLRMEFSCTLGSTGFLKCSVYLGLGFYSFCGSLPELFCQPYIYSYCVGLHV